MVQGRTREPGAVDTFHKVISLNPLAPDAHLNLGIALADQQRSEEALAEFAEAVKLAPAQAPPHYNKGRVLGDLRRYEEAVPELQQACQFDASMPDAWFRLGIAQRETQHYQEAVEAFRASLKLNPRQPDASYLLGQCHQTLGQSPEAISAWKSTLALDPNHAQALYSLSRALSKASPEEAARYRARFTSLQAQSGTTERARTLSNFGLAAAKAGKWNDAIAQLYEAIQVCGNCTSGPALHKNLGLTQCQAGRFEECEKELRSVFDDLPGDADIQQALKILENMRTKSR
jgi:tetratricopeptide (TPR) repeat protein